MADKDPAATTDATPRAWYRELNGYHWWILSVATLGWMCDTMSQRIFVLSRSRALAELLGVSSADPIVNKYGGYATAVLLIGWATGGIIFGIMGDRWGRAKTMLLTIVIYSFFTAISALSVTWWDFMICRFLTGLGVGGEFAAGVALVAEVMPTRARPHALGLLQAMSAIGNVIGSLIGLVLLPVTLQLGWEVFGAQGFAGWRLMYAAGLIPAVLVVFVMRYVKEPETWVAAKQRAKESPKQEQSAKLGSWRELFGDRRWRYAVLVGVTLGLAGQIGLWGVGFWSPELLRSHVLADLSATLQDRYTSIATALQDVGAFLGILAFTWLAARSGRRAAFAASFVVALGTIILVFGFMNSVSQIWWMIPLLGFATLSAFGGYAIYFPELFPTRLRSTGTGICYNVARYLAAVGPIMFGALNVLYVDLGVKYPFRWAAITVGMVYVIGLLVLPFAPETKGKPLPE